MYDIKKVFQHRLKRLINWWTSFVINIKAISWEIFSTLIVKNIEDGTFLELILQISVIMIAKYTFTTTFKY